MSSSKSLSYVYIGYNLPQSITLEDLFDHFNSADIVESHSSILEKNGKRTAKIAFGSERAAKECVTKYDKSLLKSAEICVKLWGVTGGSVSSSLSSSDTSCTVKVSKIPTSLSEEGLSTFIEKQLGISVRSTKTQEGTPRYAYVNCYNEGHARRIVKALNGRKMAGQSIMAKLMQQASVVQPALQDIPQTPTKITSFHKSPQNGKGSQSQSVTELARPMTAVTTQKVSTTFSVKVTNLPKSVTTQLLQKETGHIPGVTFIKVMSTDGLHNYAYVNCKSHEAGEQVIQHLNGRSIEGVVLQAYFQSTSREVSIPSQPDLSASIPVDQSLIPALSSDEMRIFFDGIERKHHVAVSLPQPPFPKFSNPTSLVSTISSSYEPMQGLVWLWENDVGEYESYESQSIATLNQAYSQNPSNNVTLKHSKWIHEIDFSKMTQTNVKTGKVRKIKRHQLQFDWLWEDDQQKLQPYSTAEQVAIEEIHSGNRNKVLIIGPHQYRFHFPEDIQQNINTLHKRRIVKTPIQTSPAKSKYGMKNMSNPKPVQISVKGSQKNVSCAEVEMKQFFDNQIKNDNLQVPKSFKSQVVQKINEICPKCYVYVDIVDGSEDLTVNLRGWDKSISEVKQNITKELMQVAVNEHSSVKASGEIPFPQEWEVTRGQSTVTQMEVKPSSAEFSQVQSKVQATLSNAVIVKIERIQNPWLWTKYHQHRELIKKKNGGVAREEELFHGTRQTDPSMIYQGEEGFDMRFSAEGLWGRGNYFAVNASYSDKYSFHLKDVNGSYPGQRAHQMFLARVTVGDTHGCPQDRSLRMPPERPSKSGGLIGIERYDSVTGHTNGSKVYIIYDNQKAYPFYLVTYYCRELNLFNFAKFKI